MTIVTEGVQGSALGGANIDHSIFGVISPISSDRCGMEQTGFLYRPIVEVVVMVRSWITLLGLVLVLAACSPNSQTTEEANPLPTTRTVTALSLGEDEVDAEAALASHQQQWEETGPSDYRYVIQADCECNLGGHLDVQVVAREVISLVRLDVSGSPTIDPEVGATIDDLFALIEEGLAVADSVDVEYADPLGYPIRINIVWYPDTTDGAIDASITEFETLE